MSIETLPISSDPSFEVTPPERQDPVEAEARTASDYVKVGIILGAGFIGWRALVKNNMPELSEPNPVTIRGALGYAVEKLSPLWLRASVPALERAYELGSHGGLDQAEVNYLATVYAKEMESYVHETSANALLEGFNALVNRKWSPQIAYRRALEGFGLTSDGMKTYIMSMENLNTDYLPNSLTEDPRVNSVLTKLLGQRAVSIGENEAYTVQEMGRQIMWMRAAEEGLIPKDSRRLWRTAKDEKVCSLCGPMNEEVVGLYDKFNVAGQEYWNPALHPNCRCWVELIEPEELAKAYDPMRTPRGGNAKNKGQFSRSWGSRANVKNKDVDPVVDQIIADALKATKKEPEAFSQSAFGSAFSSALAPAFGGSAFSESSAFKESTEELSPFAEDALVTPKQAISTGTAIAPSEQVVLHFTRLADSAFPWYEELRSITEPPVSSPRTLYGFGMERDLFGMEGATPSLDNSDVKFTGEHGVAQQQADAAWFTLSAVMEHHIKTDPEWRDEWVNHHFRMKLDRALNSYTPEQIEELQEVFDVAPEHSEDMNRGVLANKIIDEVLGNTDVRAIMPEDAEKRYNVIYEGDGFGDHVNDAYLKAISGSVSDLIDDGDDYWPDRFSRLLENEGPYPYPTDETGQSVIGRVPVPTIYEIDDAVEAEALPTQYRSSRSFTSEENAVPQFKLLGKYIVAVVERDYDNDNKIWGYPFVQKVTLVPINQQSVKKSFDPFGVVHLGVK